MGYIKRAPVARVRSLAMTSALSGWRRALLVITTYRQPAYHSPCTTGSLPKYNDNGVLFAREYGTRRMSDRLTFSNYYYEKVTIQQVSVWNVSVPVSYLFLSLVLFRVHTSSHAEWCLGCGGRGRLRSGSVGVPLLLLFLVCLLFVPSAWAIPLSSPAPVIHGAFCLNTHR